MGHFLLDTHVLLWLLTAPDKVDASIRRVLADPGVTVSFSAASIWEIAIKTALGRADFRARPGAIIRMAEATGFAGLPVSAHVAARVAELPPHHGDPFDRLLVAQAMTLPARLLTADRHLVPYSELVTLVR